jgi:DNA-binding SARP family transcriptional activator/predicted ATPase
LPLWNVRLLGGLQLRYGEREVTSINTNRMQALFSYLALRAGVPQSREHLAFLFWPDSTEPQARTNLRQLLHHLRSALPDGGLFIETDSQNIIWRASTEFAFDVADFESAASRAEEASRKGNARLARKELEDAVRLYCGDLLPGLYDEWAEVERARLRQKHCSILGRLVSLLEQAGDYTPAVSFAERLVSQDPCCEANYQSLMRLHSLKGDRAAALLAYHQCATVLQRELDTEPGPATRKLRDQITKQDHIPPEHLPLAGKPSLTHSLLVGRQKEFDRLLETWKSAAQGNTSFVMVTGESGIGKTRLVEELLTWASRHGEATATARCYAAEGRLAYAPVADWIRSATLNPVLSGLPTSQLSELVRVLPELLVERPELGIPPPLNEGWQRSHFFEALARAILGGPQPLLLFIDDLQWCDQETIEWLHYLMRLDPKAKLLVAATVRPEHVNDHHALPLLMRELNRHGSLVEIPLELLNSSETGFLADQMSNQKLDAGVIAELYRETEGNPLFVIETVRARQLSASEHSLHSPKSDSGRILNSSFLPPKVQAVLSSRLAQLSSRAQDLAALAACIGRAFTADLLARASHFDEDTMVSLLDELWQKRIIRLHGDETYDFSHDKLREVAYSELSPARRRLNHRRIAESMIMPSEANTDAVSAELARHYELAILPALAIPLYYQAAKVSQQRYAETEAIGYLTRALQLLESLPQGTERDQTELNLLVALGLSLSATQGYASPEAGRTYARARMLCESDIGKDQFFPVLWGSWVFHTVRGELRIALEMASRLVQLAMNQNNAVMLAGARFATGCSLFHVGELALARKNFLEAMAGLDSSDQPQHLTAFGPELGVFCLSYIAQVLWLLDDREPSVEYSRMALHRAEQLHHPFSIAMALDYASMLYQFRNEPSTAAARATEAAEVCEQYGFSYYLAWTPIIQGWSLAETGFAQDGVERIQQGLAALARQGAALRGPYYQTLLAQAYAQAGNVEEGLKCLSEALILREKSGECWADPMIHRMRATLLRRKGDSRGAALSDQRARTAANRLFSKKLD